MPQTVTPFKMPGARAIAKHASVVVLCFLALCVQVAYRVPGPWPILLLPWLTGTLTILSLGLLVKELVIRLPAEDPFQSGLTVIERSAGWFVRIFVYFSLALYINGRLDHSAPVTKPSELLEMHSITVTFWRPLSLTWASLRSWDYPQRTVSLILNWRERQDLWPGEPVVVRLRRGFLRLPWVSSIEPNGEALYRNVLKLAPTASSAWKELVYFYLDHGRPSEAAAATREYLSRYPNDVEFMLYVGGALGEASRFSDEAQLVEQAIARKPSYEAYNMLGWALSRLGDLPRAAQAIETAMPLCPYKEDVQAWYHLGYIYRDMGRLQDAVRMFQTVLERHPHYPEVQAQLDGLRQRLHSE